jgi:hypothetical protein
VPSAVNQHKSRDKIKRAMKDPVANPQPARRSVPADKVYRRARRTAPATEDEALNALCDGRLKERRYPLQKLLDKLGHELEQ